MHELSRKGVSYRVRRETRTYSYMRNEIRWDDVEPHRVCLEILRSTHKSPRARTDEEPAISADIDADIEIERHA